MSKEKHDWVLVSMISLILVVIVAVVYGVVHILVETEWCKVRCQEDTMVHCSIPVGGKTITMCAKKDRSVYAIPREDK